MSDSLRMAHLLDGRHFGGAEQMVRRLAGAHRAMGVDARVYCLAEGRLSDFLREGKIPTRILPSRSRFDFRMFPELLNGLRADGIQLLQAHTSRTHLLARAASRLARVPNITTIHSPIALDENQGGHQHPWRARLERIGRPWTDFVTCVSREELERLRRDEHLPVERSAHVANGVIPVKEGPHGRGEQLLAWLKAGGLPPECPLVALVAQLRPRKGAEVLLRALSITRQGGSDPMGLLIIGDDEMAGQGYLAELKKLARELEIAEWVWFAGFQGNPWQLAGGADALCLPSLFGEGQPLVALEAMNHGLPLLLSDTQGNRELIKSGDVGWLHPAGDAGVLAGQLTHLLTHPDERRRLGAAARQKFLAGFTLEHAAQGYLKIYEHLALPGR